MYEAPLVVLLNTTPSEEGQERLEDPVGPAGEPVVVLVDTMVEFE